MQIVIANSKGGSGKTTLVLALADVLKADVIDHDAQGTIRNASNYTGRHIPKDAADATSKYIIHDTPPYNSDANKSLFEIAQIILIPAKMAQADLLAVDGVVTQLRALKIVDKAYIVFNEVRKPPTRVHRKVRGYFESNYKDVKKAATELSSLVAFRDILETPVYGKATDQIIALLEEIGILYT